MLFLQHDERRWFKFRRVMGLNSEFLTIVDEATYQTSCDRLLKKSLILVWE